MTHFFFVCVVSELPPQILTEDGSTYTFTEGHKALLECDTFGSPQPKVTWWGATVRFTYYINSHRHNCVGGYSHA